MTSPSDLPPSTAGKVIINAHLFAAPGQADRLQEHLDAIKKFSLSDQDPGCLEFKTARSFVIDGSVKFSVWEAYTSVEALAAHSTTPAVQDMITAAKAGLLSAAPLIEYYYEF